MGEKRILHCWKDRADHAADVHGWGSDEWAKAYVDNATCMRERGHDGPHDFVPDDQIVVSREAGET